MSKQHMRLPLLIAVAAAVLLPATGGALEVPSDLILLKRSPQFRGLDRRYKVIAVEEADLDGDGLKEQVAAFVSRRKGCGRGGFAVFAMRAGKHRVEWAGLYESGRPENLIVAGGDIRSSVVTQQGRVRVRLSHGKDFWLRNERQSPFAGMKIRASSQVVKGPKAALLAPANLIDQDPLTVWCNASVGTGAGEWVELEFAKPVDLAMVGVLGGDYRSKAKWNESNRIYRFEMIAETHSDRTAVVEDEDISAMLKLPSMGKRVNAVAADARRTKWAEIRSREVVTLKIQVTSVYLGDQNDEVYISEIDLGVLLPDPKPDSGAEAPEAAPQPKTPAPALDSGLSP
ncbi:MAG: hypothetical protein HY901_23255 [Deltaproteobacteria bacterium]|nr:hypothetical protein [Deltaproteobacteria bacterium]